MKYQGLIESCRVAIKNEWCLGCQALEDPNFKGKYNCEGATPPPKPQVQKCIDKIHEILGIQEKMKL